LLKLQQILLLRELDVDLAAIAAVVNGVRDQVDALRAHHERLLADGARLARLAQTVVATIAHFEEGTSMPPEEMFDGFRFTRETIDELEALAVERSGRAEQPPFEELKRRTADWTHEDFRQVEREGADIERRLLQLIRDGVAAGDPAVFAVLDDVVNQRRLMPLDGEGYAKLGEALATAPELRAHLDAWDPRLAEYMRDAMVAYAATRMR
jgi:hypothetical protein